MIRPLCSILISALASASGLAGDLSLPVVMVADLAGKVVRGGGQPLALAEGIPAHRGLTLAAGARLSVIHLKTGEELLFTGPGTVSFDTEGRPLGAKPASLRKIATLGEGFHLEPGAWAQASVVMRKEVIQSGPIMELEESMPFSPSSVRAGQGVWLQPLGTAILDNRPEFRWHLPLPGLVARLRITDSAGKYVFDQVVRGESLRLAIEQGLRPGGDYRWRLSWTLPDGLERYTEGEFRVLSATEARLIQSLRPAQDASFAERLAFAVALETGGLQDEARTYWLRLAAERPEDATLHRFAAP